MSLQNIAEQYFSKINPIAKRLYADINDTKAAYDKLWTTLSEDEKDQIINESIIKPEACLQYNAPNSEMQTPSEYAVKMIVEDNCTYRDEHSAPFTFRTPSQRDLRLFGEIKEKPKVCAAFNNNVKVCRDNFCRI